MSAGGNPARALGYKLLGPRLDYILHLRPAEWPIMAGHTLLGALLALGLARAASGEQLGAVLLGLVLWVVALNGGTLAINSAFDKDEGDVAYLRRPPEPPRGLFAFGLGLMVVGLFVSLLLPSDVHLALRHVPRDVGAVLGAADATQGGGGCRLDHQPARVRHADAAGGVGEHG